MAKILSTVCGTVVSCVSRFAAAGTVAEEGVKVAEAIVTAMGEQLQCKPFFQMSDSCSWGGPSLTF